MVATHDERLLALADQIIEMRPNFLPDEVTSRSVQIEAGANLFEQGDPSDLIYVLDSGQLEVFRDSPDGEILLSVIEPGEHIGEMGPLFGLHRTATVRARTASSLTGYSAKAFRNLVGDDRIPSLIRAATDAAPCSYFVKVLEMYAVVPFV